MSDIRAFSRAFASRQKLAVLVLFILGAVVSSISPGRAQAPGSQKPAFGPGQTAHGAGRLVDPRKLPRASVKRTPFEEPDDAPPGYAEAKARANAKTEPLPVKGPFSLPHVVSRAPRTPMKLSGGKPVSPATQGGIEHEGRGQAATSKSAQAPPPIFGNAFLLDQEQFVGNSFCDVSSSCFSPPDTQVAAGFNEIVALSNNTMRVISKGGVVLQTNDLTPFFFAASDQTATDGKVVFDSGAGRYYMTDLLVNGLGPSPTGSQVKLAVSQSSDPTGGWCVYSFGFFTRTDGTVLDQPKVGFSDDKIMISENENGGTPEDFDILQKSDVLASCSGVAGTGFSNSDFNLMPVISLSSTADMFAVYNFNSCFLFICSQNAGILDITGTPAAGNVSIAETDKGINGLNTPPQAVQPAFPSGGTAPIDTSDNRYSTAVFQFGHIWAGADDACNPGDGNHACLRFDEFDATNGFNVLDDREIQSQGQDLYYPAISLDSSGNIFFVYTVSSSTMFPTVQTGASGLPFGSSFAAFNNFSGDSTYQCTFCKNKDGSLRPRWGDFSGAGQDPNNTSTIWLAGEFGANSSLAQGSDGWSTGIVALTFDIPFAVSATPSSGPSSGGTFVDIRGGGFVNGGTSVFFGGVASPSVSFVSTDELFALTPAEAPGHTGVTPDTANGFGFDFTLGFDFHPSVTSLSPASGPASGGNSVTIFGTGFTGATNVHFGGTGAAFVVNNDGSITATAPAGVVGSVNVTVTTNGETSLTSFSDVYTYDAQPTVSSVSPNAGPIAGGNTVTINGANFLPGAVVKFSSTASALVTFVSSTQVKAVVPAHAAGTVDVRVITPGGPSLPSPADHYTYDAQPTVSSVSPNAGPIAGGNTVTINGTNFLPGATVKFSSTASASVTFVSSTQVKAVVPAHAAGTVDVRVITPGGANATSAADHYTYDAQPTVSSVSPNAGPIAGGNTVTINGTNFLPGATVKFSSTASASVTFVSSTQVKAVVPAHAAGTVDVRVITPGGANATSAADHYTYDAKPTVTSFTPTSGITGSTVTINGTGFVPGATVKFGAKASATVTFVSGTQIKATVPNGAVTAKISVTTPGGTATSVSNFTVTLSVTGFSPASGPTGTVVTINGVGFNSSSAVKFNGVAASSVTHVSATQLKATVPSTATTGPITVTNTTVPTGTVRSAVNYTKT